MMKNNTGVFMDKGLFIVLEGPDGAGKSTVARLIADYLKKGDTA